MIPQVGVLIMREANIQKARVMFVFPDILPYAPHSGYFHYGLASVSAYLKQEIDCHVSMYHIVKEDVSQNQFIDRIRTFGPDIVAFTATTNSFPVVSRYSGWVKKYSEDIITVCGGVHATIATEDALEISSIDFIVKGDGERPLVSIVKESKSSRDFSKIKGVWCKVNGHIHRGGTSVFENLDELPMPDWDSFDYMNLEAPRQGLGGIMLSRGCPYQCSYCCNHAIRKGYEQEGAKYIRRKSVDRSIEEIKTFIAKFPKIHTLYFDDDILALDKKWFTRFVDRYKREIAKPYWCNMRPNLIDDEIARLLSDSGCIRVGIGIESGNESIRTGILNRNVSDKQIVDAVYALKRNNLYVYSFNMVGLPFEDKESLLDTIRLNGSLGIDKMQCDVFYPYQRTALYDLCVKNDLIIKGKHLIAFHRDSILKLDRAQRSRVLFTELYINILSKLCHKLPRPMDLAFRIVYSAPSALLFLPTVTWMTRKLLSVRLLATITRRVYRKIVKPPTA